MIIEGAWWFWNAFSLTNQNKQTHNDYSGNPQQSDYIDLSRYLNMFSRTLGRSSLKWRPTSKLLLSAHRAISTNNGFLKISEEVQEAIHSKKPIVALETTIYTHGSVKGELYNEPQLTQSKVIPILIT
jgi:hypothetical protein